jgi:chromatin remodeling complex protein RSC6
MPKTENKSAAPKKANSALAKPVQPDEALSAIVGSDPLPRTELTKKLWDYIKKHKLQDEKKKTQINADKALKAVFDGRDSVTMFEMTKLVSGHVNK